MINFIKKLFTKRKPNSGIKIAAMPNAVILIGAGTISMTPALAHELAKVLPRYAETASRLATQEA